MFLLYWSNQSMMKLKFDAKIALTHRYQLAENLRVVQIMTPITNLYVTFAFFLYMYRDKRTRRKIICILHKNSKVATEKQSVTIPN
uniref:Uncharacterized protein n=1 Tax=Acrobeloides nanus TaxID=290746 RepID=A0A914E9K4_9BILA